MLSQPDALLNQKLSARSRAFVARVPKRLRPAKGLLLGMAMSIGFWLVVGIGTYEMLK